MVYGVFDGEYSDWGVRGYFTTRDLSRKEEGEKYAENFLNDLVKEIGGIE